MKKILLLVIIILRAGEMESVDLLTGIVVVMLAVDDGIWFVMYQ